MFMFTAYATLFRTPGAVKFSVAGLIGRMPISMDSLALVFIVVAASDSYALAGALSATASIVMSIAVPYWSGVADRIGQRALLIRAVPFKAAGIILFIVLVQNNAPIWTWFASIIVSMSYVFNMCIYLLLRVKVSIPSRTHLTKAIVRSIASLRIPSTLFMY